MNFKTNEIRIEIDQRASRSWSEIDAVELVGTPGDVVETSVGEGITYILFCCPPCWCTE